MICMSIAKDLAAGPRNASSLPAMCEGAPEGQDAVVVHTRVPDSKASSVKDMRGLATWSEVNTCCTETCQQNRQTGWHCFLFLHSTRFEEACTYKSLCLNPSIKPLKKIDKKNDEFELSEYDYYNSEFWRQQGQQIRQANPGGGEFSALPQDG